MKFKEYKTYYSNGQLLRKYYTNKNGKREEKYLSYHSNGQLWEKCYFKNGNVISREEYLMIKIRKVIK